MADATPPQNPQNEPVRRLRRASNVSAAGWKVLVVDDQPDNLSVAEAALQFHGAEVCIARNGIEGLIALEQFAATLILLDLSMPEMNGWEMLEQLRQNKAFASIPVIALTAHAMETDEERVMEAGFDGYIAKPFSVMTIVSEIQAILQIIAAKESSV